MSFQSSRSGKKMMADMNVVPFIDVMLVLLVIFMITAPLLTQGVKVDLPKATAAQLPDKEPVIVTIDAKRNFYLNIADKPQLPLTERALNYLLTQELKDLKDRQVMVRGDKNVDYGAVMQAMLLLQQAGATSVGLITEPSVTLAKNKSATHAKA